MPIKLKGLKNTADCVDVVFSIILPRSACIHPELVMTGDKDTGMWRTTIFPDTSSCSSANCSKALADAAIHLAEIKEELDKPENRQVIVAVLEAVD